MSAFYWIIFEEMTNLNIWGIDNCDFYKLDAICWMVWVGTISKQEGHGRIKA